MGPRSLALLQDLSDEDLSQEAFPFSTVREISIGYNFVRATRVSFVGEMGWELSIPIEQAQAIYQTLVAAGNEFGLVHVGHMALDSCRLEKGYKHWGHDIVSKTRRWRRVRASRLIGAKVSLAKRPY